jgi:hypothetical protein
MTVNPAEWICPLCSRAPSVTLELHCPACKEVVRQSINVDFKPCGSNDDHNRHIAAEDRWMRDKMRHEANGGTVTEWIPDFFKEHIRSHEEWAFQNGAASRDSEIRHRLDEVNKRAESIIAELTAEILLKRQQECEHRTERRWVSAESGRMNLLCSACFKVLDAKFVGTATPREPVGLKVMRDE